MEDKEMKRADWLKNELKIPATLKSIVESGGLLPDGKAYVPNPAGINYGTASALEFADLQNRALQNQRQGNISFQPIPSTQAQRDIAHWDIGLQNMISEALS